jgi:hypothetical protein
LNLVNWWAAALVEFERELADLHGKASALVFTSGSVSNQTGISQALRIWLTCQIQRTASTAIKFAVKRKRWPNCHNPARKT